jgi:hypothetical protein
MAGRNAQTGDATIGLRILAKLIALRMIEDGRGEDVSNPLPPTEGQPAGRRKPKEDRSSPT